MRKVGIEVIGNSASAARAFARTGEAASLFGREMTKVSITAAKSAEVQTKAALATQTRLREQIVAARELSASYAIGSREQLAALGVANKMQRQLARTAGVSAQEQSLLLRGNSRERAREHSHSVGRLRERARIGNRLANITGFGPGFLGLAGIGVAIDKSVRATVSFREQMELIATQAGATQREVTRMSGALLNMAPRVGQTPEELAKGLFHIESYGIRGARALRLLRMAAEGAAVGKAPLESVANALLAISGSHIRGVHGPGQAMGVMNAIIGAGNMRMEELTGAISTGVLAKAKNFGISIQEVGAALGVMTHGGVPAQEAATRLGMTFAKLAAGTPAAEKELKKIGLTTLELGSEIRTKGLMPALQDLKAHLDASGLSASQQAALLTRAFGGGRSSGGLMTLIQNLDDFQKTQDRIARTTGQFGAAWEKTQHQAAFATKNFKAALSVLGITLGAELVPALTKLMVKFTTWITKMVKTGQLQRDIHQGMRKVGAAAHFIADIAKKANSVAQAFGGWKRVIGVLLALKFASKLAGWASKIRDIRIAARAAEGVIGGKTGLLGVLARLALMNPIGLTITVSVIGGALALKTLYTMLGGDIPKGGVQPVVNPNAKGLAKYNYPGRDSSGNKLPRPKKHDFTTVATESDAGVKGPQDPGRVNLYDHGKLIGSNLTLAEARRRERAGTTATRGGSDAAKRAHAKAVADMKRMHLREVAAERLTVLKNAVVRAKLTKSDRDDLKALKAEERYLVEALKTAGHNAKLRHQLLTELVKVRKAESKLGPGGRNAAQFRLLGLNSSGSTLAPTKAALRRELGNVESVMKGTFLDTAKHRTLLGNIRRLLSGQLGALSREVRDKIKELLDGLKGQMNEFDGFNLTKADRRRRFIDRQFADRYGNHPDHPSQGGGSHTTVHHQPITVHVADKKEWHRKGKQLAWQLRSA